MDHAGGMSRSSLAQGKWRRTIDDHQYSGLTVSAFCRRRGVAQSSFFAWKRRLDRAQRWRLH